MKIAVGADHAGFAFKEKVKAVLTRLGHEVVDVGTFSTDSVDYPDFGVKVAKLVAGQQADLGVTVCMTGNGMNIAANKVKGIRSALVLNPEMAQFTRAHNNANVMALAQKYTPEAQLEEILTTFLNTPFEGGRHERRVEKISAEELASGM